MDNPSLDLTEETLRNASSHRRRTVSFSGNVRQRSEETDDILVPEPEPEPEFNEETLHESFAAHVRRKHSAYSFTNDLPESALKEVKAVIERSEISTCERSEQPSEAVGREPKSEIPLEFSADDRTMSNRVLTKPVPALTLQSNIPRRRSTYVAAYQLQLRGFQRVGRAVWDHSDSVWAQVASWIILVLLLWAMVYCIVETDAGTTGELFRLLALILVAYMAGRVMALVRLPPLLGMLVSGVVLRNVGFYHPAVGEYSHFTRVLKQMATTVGMVRAGMRLVPDAIYVALHCHNGLRLTGLGMVPSFMEAMVTAVISYLALDYPAIWALCLGFLLCPNSPSVITPPMVELMENGYGEQKHIGVLVHGAAGLDVAFSVSIFDICLAMLFHGRNLHPVHMLWIGGLDVLVDIFGGFVLGLIAGLLPVQDNAIAVWKRTIAVMAGGMIAIVSGPKVGLPGTGPLSCICTAFVASMLWKLQTPLTAKCTMNDIMNGSWVVLCPMLFGFTGSDVDINALNWRTLSWMLGIVMVTVFIRLLACFLVLCGGEFNYKEMLFIGLIFQGKATNQAALAPQILYAAWASQIEDDEQRAVEAVTMGVLSILICTPLAHLGAKLGGPCLLSRQPRPSAPPPTTEQPPPPPV